MNVRIEEVLSHVFSNQWIRLFYSNWEYPLGELGTLESGMVNYLEKKQLIKEKTGYEFSDMELMKRAITTRDYIEKTVGNGQTKKNPLATLGDSVIKVIVFNRLLKDEKDSAGDLSEESKKYISRAAQTKIAQTNGLEDVFVWSPNEISMKVWEQENPLGECLEALLGGIYFENQSIDICESILETIDFFNYDVK